MTYWGFVIDFSPDTGSDAEELAAYLTGWTAEEDYLKVVDEELSKYFPNLMLKLSFEKGFLRFFDIFPNPRYLNNGMGFIYKPGEEEVALEKNKESFKNWAEKVFKIYEKSNIAYAIAEKQRLLSETKTIEDIKCPAYLSTIIYFDSEPTPEQIDILKSRAESFVQHYQKLVIEGFRLVKFIETQEITDL